MSDVEKKIKQIENLKKLSNSPGWAYIREVMNEEILKAAYAMAEATRKSLDQINFERGAMWAARRCLDLPQRLMQILESDATMLAAQEQLKSKPKETT